MKNWKENISNLSSGGKKSKKWLWIIIGVVAVAGLAASSMLKSLEVDTVVVKKEDVKATVWEKGKVKSRDAVDIFSEVQGKVKKVYFDIGDKVEKGAPLAVIDVSEIESQIARLEGELKVVEGQAGSNQVKQQQLAVEQAKVALELAEEAYDRVKELYDNGAATKVELDQSKADVDTKRKAVAQAQASLASLSQQSSGQKESLSAQLNYLKSQKQKAVVKTDREGLIFTNKVKEGDVVAPGVHLFTVGQKSQVEIEAYVNNKDIAYVKEGDTVAVVFKVPGEDLEVVGTITNIAPAAEEIVSSLGIVEDKIKVKVELKGKPEGVNLTPGMSVDVVVTVQESKDVVAIPKEAVFTDKGKNYVWVVKEGKAAIVEVETAVEGDKLLQVKKGLNEGDIVIKNPHMPELKEGIKVK